MNKYTDEFDKENKVNRKSKKKLIVPVTAALTAAAVIGAMVIPAAAQPNTSTAMLTLTSESEDTVETTSVSYVLSDVSDIVENALPSVVSITSRSLVNDYYSYYGNGSGMEDIWEYFFGGNSSRRGGSMQQNPGDSYYGESNSESADESEEAADDHSNEVESGLGSGTIVSQNDEELLILTSYHVVEDCSSLYVTFINDVNVDGYIKSADEDKDIAIVAVPLADIDQDTMNSISVAPICTEEPEVGEGVIVIGNALGYGVSVTTGIVSAVNREITVDGKTLTVIQTDAAINSGNSGGCMLNAKGEVIGISEAKVAVSYVEGMCYAIPVSANLDLIQELLNSDGIISEDTQTSVNGGYLGIYGRDVTAEMSQNYGMPQGVYVAETVEGGGAKDAGIQSGDIIVGVDGEEVSSMEELQSKVTSHAAGDVLTITLMRMSNGGYESEEVEVTLTDRIG